VDPIFNEDDLHMQLFVEADAKFVLGIDRLVMCGFLRTKTLTNLCHEFCEFISTVQRGNAAKYVILP